MKNKLLLQLTGIPDMGTVRPWYYSLTQITQIGEIIVSKI